MPSQTEPSNRSADAASPPVSAWKHRVFRALWLAGLGSGIGSTMHDTAAVWTLATLTDRAWVVTLFQSLLSLPLVLFALPSGALADILDKRVHLIRVQWAGAVVALGMAALAWAGQITPTILLSGAFLLGTAMAFALPAWNSLIPEVIERPMMASAITLGSVGVNVSRAIGPLLGGLLVAATGPAPAFLGNGLSFLALALVLGRWHRPRPEAKPHAETVVSAMIAAVRHVRYSRPIQRVLIRHGLFTFSAFSVVALLPILVQRLGLPASSFGLLMGIYGAGGILSALFLLPWLRRKFTVDQILLGAGVAALLAAVVVPFARDFQLLAGVLFVSGGAWLITMAQLNFAGQSVFPHWVRARASSVQLLAFQGALAVGAMLWGDLTGRFSPKIALLTAAGGLVIYLIATWRLPVDRSLGLDLSPATHDHSHDQLALVPESDQGPVRVSVRYRVDAAEESAFFRAIAELRDSRLRDGAYRWHLWRDLQDPRVLWEVFLVGSWEEHLRQADRTTHATQAIERRVTQFHRDESPPRVDHALHLEPGTGDCPLAKATSPPDALS